MDIDIIHIGNRIKKRRMELNLSTNDIKRETGISTGALSNIENGKRTPSIIIFYAIAKSLKCSMDWLISGETSNSEKQSITLTEEKLLTGFRNLSGYNQREVLEIIEVKQRTEQEISRLEQKGEGHVKSSSSHPDQTIETA